MPCLEDGILCGTLTPSTFSYLSAAHKNDRQLLDFPGCILGDTPVLCWAHRVCQTRTACPWHALEQLWNSTSAGWNSPLQKIITAETVRYKKSLPSSWWYLDLTLSEIAGLKSSFSSYELNSGHILQDSEGHMFAPAGKNGFWSTTKLAYTMRVIRTQETSKWSCYIYIHRIHAVSGKLWGGGGELWMTNLKAKPMN